MIQRHLTYNMTIIENETIPFCHIDFYFMTNNKHRAFSASEQSSLVTNYPVFPSLLLEGFEVGYSDDRTKLKWHLGQVGPARFDSFKKGKYLFIMKMN